MFNRLAILLALAGGLMTHADAQTYPGNPPSASICLGQASGSCQWQTLSGDMTNTAGGVATISNGVVGNGKLATMGAGTIKGTVGGGAPADLTGAQAESVLQFTQAGTGAIANRTVDSKLKDWVSALDFAVGNCSTDDSTAIQNAINSLTNGGMVYFPPAPGGCYAIGAGTAITLPTTKAVALIGAGRGESGANIGTATGGTVLKATASITSMITTGTSFQRGNRISNMILDGNAQAQYNLKMDGIDAATFDSLNLYNATLINFRLGNGATNTQANSIVGVYIDNPATTVLANLPTYNFENNGINNDIVNLKGANAKTANIHLSSTASGNKYVNVHGYDFFSGAAQAPVNNFLIDANFEQITNWEADGSSSANVQINGFGNLLSNGNSQFQSPLSAQIGVQFATATSGNLVYGNIFESSTTANTIVQAGTAAGPGNFYIANYNSSQGTVIGSRFINTIAPTITAGCSGAGSSVGAGASKYSGRIIGQTAAATTCTVTFNGGGFAATPRCTPTGETGAITSFTPGTTTLVVNFASTASFTWDYTCEGN